MEEGLEKYRSNSLSICEKLIHDLQRNQNDAASFFGGDIYRAYRAATEEAIEKAQKCKNKIRNL